MIKLGLCDLCDLFENAERNVFTYCGLNSRQNWPVLHVSVQSPLKTL